MIKKITFLGMLLFLPLNNIYSSHKPMSMGGGMGMGMPMGMGDSMSMSMGPKIKSFPSLTPPPAARSSKAKCEKCFELGFSVMPTVGVDYDRNRYIVYLGSDEVVSDEISRQTGLMTGPFEVVEFGRFSASIGGVVSMGLPYTASINLGLKIKGSTGFESTRIATTMKQAKSFKRIRKFPRTFKMLMGHPDGTIITTRLSGGIVFSARAVAGYVVSAGGEFAASGEWMVKVAKVNPYLAMVSIQDIKITDLAASAGIAGAGVSKSRNVKNEVFFSFELNLETKRGIKAYNDLFKGNIKSVQQMARRYPKMINQLEKEKFKGKIIKQLVESKSKTVTSKRTLSVGLPFLGSATRDRGSEAIMNEELRFLSDQDITFLGAVTEGTMVRTIRGVYSTGKYTAGLLSKHKARSKRFIAKIEDISFPLSDIASNQKNSKGYQRISLSYKYSFHKNKWKQKDWEEELKFMSRRIGYRIFLLGEIKNPIRGKSTNYASMEASLKISEAAFKGLIAVAKRKGKSAYTKELIRLGKARVKWWFDNKEYKNYEMCENLINCRNRISGDTEKAIKKGVEFIFKADKVFKKMVENNTIKTKKALIKTLVGFGSGFSKNQFTMATFLQDIKMNRIHNLKQDFSFCVQWKGSSFRQNELIILPSRLRKDRKKCYLVEDTQFDEKAKKNDRELFGSDFILDL
ncbi:MAG: hypothetical protein DRQ89_12980 [Epsilonproteobacteria bacterium]|nr:MAG: hypothetical protein DRQ89_12980 [Campylobacterota bacterium]